MIDRRFLRISDVEHIVGLKRSTIYALVQRGEFPRQVRLSRRAVAWNSADIEEFIKDRIGHSRRPDCTSAEIQATAEAEGVH